MVYLLIFNLCVVFLAQFNRTSELKYFSRSSIVMSCTISIFNWVICQSGVFRPILRWRGGVFQIHARFLSHSLLYFKLFPCPLHPTLIIFSPKTILLPTPTHSSEGLTSYLLTIVTGSPSCVCGRLTLMRMYLPMTHILIMDFSLFCALEPWNINLSCCSFPLLSNAPSKNINFLTFSMIMDRITII